MANIACVGFEEAVDLVEHLSRVDRLRLLAHIRLAIAVEGPRTPKVAPLAAYETSRDSRRQLANVTVGHQESRAAFQWDDF